MLNKLQSFAPRKSSGFNLIELMISILIGLLVVAGAVKLIVTINQSNATTVTSARLTQELRTTLEVIASDLRRARRVDDPIGQIGVTAADQAQVPPVAYKVVTDPIASPTAGCLTYGYQSGLDGEGFNASDPQPANYYHAVYRQTNAAGVGAVVLVTGDTAANVTCTATPTVTLSSAQIDITDLRFEPATPPPAAGTPTTVDNDAIKVTISGRPQFRTGDNLNVTRTITQIVNVRSGKSGT